MSNQPTTPPAGGPPPTSAGAPSTAGANPPPPAVKVDEPPITQQTSTFRTNWPSWAKQLPQLRFPPPNPTFELIDRKRLRDILKDADPGAITRIEDDLKFLENELLRLFRDRDYEAALQQNRYRLYQILYILLAALATLLGSIQALVLNTNRTLLPWLAFGETIVALLATFLATISGREPPLPLYLNNRRRAESLRREYFRFLMGLPPYDTVEGPDRRQMLSVRAADINRGVFPDEGQA
jgi:Protein of unknown function (DUF4231)